MTPLTWALELGAALLFAVLLVVRLRARRGRVVERRPGLDGDVVVRRTAAHLELWLERGRRRTLQGRVRLDDPRVSGLAYTDGFFLHLPPPGGSALFVGLGAGTGPRQLALLRPDVAVVVVERDPAVAAAAAAHFGGAGDARLLIDDGRAHLERDAARHDLIVLDAFGAGVTPASLATVEAFRLARERLRDPGTLVVNLGGRLTGRVIPPVLAALAEAFGPGQVAVHGVPREDGARFDPDRAGNTIALGFRGPPPLVPGPEPSAGDALLPRLGRIAATPVTPPPAPPLHDGSGPADRPIA